MKPGSSEKADVLGFNNAIWPDRTRPACLVPFEMVTKPRLRDKPEQALLSLHCVVGEGEGRVGAHAGFANKGG